MPAVVPTPTTEVAGVGHGNSRRWWRWPWRPRWWRLRPWRIGGDHAALLPKMPSLHLSESSRRKQLGPRAGWFVAERTVRTGRSAAAPHDCHSGNRNCPDVSGNSRSSRSRSTLDGLSPADEARSALHGFPCPTNQLTQLVSEPRRAGRATLTSLPARDLSLLPQGRGPIRDERRLLR